MSRFTTVCLSVVAAGALFLAGCGDDDDAAASGAEGEIESLIVRHYAEPSCDDLTESGRTEFGHPAEDEACAEDISSQSPKDVDVSDVMVDGSSGTAVADGFTFSVVEVGGTWLIDGGA